MNALRRLAVMFLLAVAALGCRDSAKDVAVYTSVDQVFSQPILGGFATGGRTAPRATFDTEETKSTGVLNRIIAESAHPQADVFWSGDPMRALVLVQKGLAEPYVSPNAASIPAEYKAKDGAWTGFGARARVLLVNTDKIPASRAPHSVKDLVSLAYKGQIAIANPLYGTTTMHVAALSRAWGDAELRAFFAELRKNDARVASSNGEVKRLVVSGEVAFGLLDTDDAHEAITEKAHVTMIFPDQDGMGTLVVPTAVVLIKNAPHPARARELIDFLLTPEVEKALAERAAHMPLRKDVHVEGVPDLAGVRAMKVDYADLATEIARLEPWLRQWVGL